MRADPATREFQRRIIGTLAIRHHEISTRLSDDYFFTVELDLNVHDEAVPHKEAPAGVRHARRGFQVDRMLAGREPTTKILPRIVTSKGRRPKPTPK